MMRECTHEGYSIEFDDEFHSGCLICGGKGHEHPVSKAMRRAGIRRVKSLGQGIPTLLPDHEANQKKETR